MRELTPDEAEKTTGGVLSPIYERDYVLTGLDGFTRIMRRGYPMPPDICLGFYCNEAQ